MLPTPIDSPQVVENSPDHPDEYYVEPYDDSKMVVQTSRPEEQEEDDQPAPFYGEHRSRVKQQMKSPISGRFNQGTAIARKGKRKGTGSEELDSLSDEGFEAGGDNAIRDLMMYSSRPNALSEDILDGPETVLNTDPVKFASFINRVADEIYDPWVTLARDAVDAVYSRGGRLAANIYITKLTVAMNEQGEIASIRILKGSGIRELDDAPRRAFWEAGPFRNPPNQMMREDGLMRFVYEFHFHWKQSSFNIVPLI